MAMYMKASGQVIKLRDLEYIHIWMVLDMKENGKKINNMEEEGKPGLMVHVMMEIM